MKHFLGAMLVSVLTVAVMAPNPARSAVIINFEETGGNVTMDLSGSLDLTGATPSGGGPIGLALFSPTSSIADAILLTGTGLIDRYLSLSGPSVVGGGGPPTVFPDSPSSTSFWLRPLANEFAVPSGYASGDPLNITLTFTGQTFMSLGLTEGDQFVWTLPNDTITMNIGPLSVPAPAGLPLALAGLGAVAFVRRRRKRSA